jgi:hypothetical protein
MNIDRYLGRWTGGCRCYLCRREGPPEPQCWLCGRQATACKVWFRALEEAVWDHACKQHSTKLTLAT